MELLLLRRCGRLDPNPGIEVELIPGRGQHFAAARAGQQQQPDEMRTQMRYGSANRTSKLWVGGSRPSGRANNGYRLRAPAFPSPPARSPCEPPCAEPSGSLRNLTILRESGDYGPATLRMTGTVVTPPSG